MPTMKNFTGEFDPLENEFETALDKFEDQSIDLLHIDGSHEYEAVKVISKTGCQR